MFIYGVVNASPDSLNLDSIVRTPEEALARARQLLADGADGLDVGGQGSTDVAEVVPWQAEWERLEHILPALATLGVPMSVDTWRPEVLRLALQHGANVINAADGMQADAMWEVATDFDVVHGLDTDALDAVDADEAEHVAAVRPEVAALGRAASRQREQLLDVLDQLRVRTRPLVAHDAM